MTFIKFCQSLGIIPPEVFIPGKRQRCATVTHPRKKNAGVQLNEDGKSGIAVNFETSKEAQIWRENGSGKERTAEQRSRDNAALSERLAKAREDERKAITRAKGEYDRATGLLGAAHPYCVAKSLSMLGCNGLRVDASGNLLIPMYRDGRLVSVQRVSATGEKKFAAGCPAKLATFTITRPKSAVTILAEGFATGCTVFEAVQMSRVIVCFSAGNLVAVAEHGDWMGAVIIAGDNDAMTREIHGVNPGEEAARKAAAAMGCGYAIPIANENVDFNDLFVMRLETLEEREEFKRFKISPSKLRQMALTPIRIMLMKALTGCGT